MAVSYEYSIGSVRARETALFTKTDFEQLLGCTGTQELCQTLSDKGYGSVAAFDEMLDRHAQEVWRYLKSVAPDMTVFHPFLLPTDAHNFKVTLKGIMAARDYYKDLLLTPCTVAHDVIIDAVEHRSMKALPAWMQDAAGKAYDLLAHTGDAKTSDAVLDKAVMEEMLQAARAYRSDFLKEYFCTLVFYNNVKIALRGARTGADAAYFRQALAEDAGFHRDKIIAAAVKGEDALTDVLSKIRDYGCDKAMEAYKASPTAFEKFADDRLMLLAKESCKRICEGAEPLLGYYLGEEAQKKALQIIYSGVKTGADTDTIRERLREIYG